MTGTPATADKHDRNSDAGRRRALRQMRMVATGLLLLAAIIYVATLRNSRIGWLGFVNAGAEAAMIGALADWFAVTAIFRHPLGIPIPHTALIKKRKNDLGRSLQHFVSQHFLTEQIIKERIAEAAIAQRLANWLADRDHRQSALAQLVKGGRVIVSRIKDDDIVSLIQENLVPRLTKEDFSPVAGAFLAGIVDDGAHQGFVDLVFAELHSWLLRHPDSFRAVIDERTPRWSPRWFDRRVIDWAYDQALEWTAAVRDERQHRARIALDQLLAKLADDMQHDPLIMAKTESLKERLLTSSGLVPAMVALWKSVQSSLITAMDDRHSSLWRRCDGWLQEFGELLSADWELQNRIDLRLQDAGAFLVRTYGEELTTIISTTVERWDASEAAERIELFVGRDLQFIRINGTVVGALAGLAIHGVSQLLP